MVHTSVEDSSHQASLKELHAELQAHGLFQPCRFWVRKLLVWIPTFFLSYAALMVLPFGPLWLAVAPVCAVAWLTMGFVGHDAGHYALSRRPWVNDLWGQIGMTFICGMSFG